MMERQCSWKTRRAVERQRIAGECRMNATLVSLPKYREPASSHCAADATPKRERGV